MSAGTGVVDRSEPDEHVLVIGCDPAGIIVSVDGPLSDWFGYSPQTVLGQPIVSFMHPRNQEISSSLVSILAGKTDLELREDLRIRSADGGWVWVDATIYGRDCKATPLAVAARRLSSERSESLDRRHEPTDVIVDSERRLRILADAAPIGVFMQMVDGTFFVNRRWQEITGLSRPDAADGAWMEIIHPDDLQGTVRAYEQARRAHQPVSSGRFRINRPDGSLRWVEVSWAPAQGDENQVDGIVGTLQDVTDSVLAVNRSARLTHALEATPDLVVVWDAVDDSVSVNDAARTFLDAQGAVELHQLMAFVPQSVSDHWNSQVAPNMAKAGIWRGEIEVPDATGRLVPLSAVYMPRYGPTGGLLGVAAICRDITEFKDLEAQLDHQATHDPLTGLPNRVLLRDRLEVALARAARDHTLLAVLFLDLDRFKVVNDSLGHAQGDEVLVALATRIEAVLRPAETVARFGGDEFVVIAEDLPDPAAALKLAERLTQVTTEPLDIGDRRFVVSGSIGVATSTGCEDDDADSLIRDADTAMYRAKARGGNGFELFELRTREEAVGRMDLESGLRRAIETDELRLHFQPTIALDTGRIVGAEALVRWQHPERGLLKPDQFLGVATESNLMPDLGAWVIDRSFAMLSELSEIIDPTDGSPNRLTMCLNLSAQDLADPGIVARIVEAAERHGVDPTRVGLELTEHTLMEEIGSTGDALSALSALGYQIAIDDFGTGYSSLAYLRNFPVDLLKIDRTFVDGLIEQAADRAIVTAVMALAEALGLTVVAEGVEEPEQLDLLRQLGCDMAQGYLMSPPIPAEELLALVAARPSW